MAFKIRQGQTEVGVVLRMDDAVHCTDKEYKEYLTSFSPDSPGDESILKLSEEPTRFVLRINLTWEGKRKVESGNMKIRGGKATVDPYYMKDLLRHSFKAIKNPPQVKTDDQLKFVKDNDRMISKAFLNDLERMGELDHLMIALANSKKKDKEDESDEYDDEDLGEEAEKN